MSDIAPTLPARPPLAVGASEAARLSGVSRSTWHKLVSAGGAPPPTRIGRRTVWHVATLDRWLALGCPSAERLRAMQQDQA